MNRCGKPVPFLFVKYMKWRVVRSVPLTIELALVEIVETLPEAQKAKVLIHEWAHGLLHSLADRPERETRELEAESTAFVVASALGFDTADYSFGYIVGWRGEEAIQTLKACGTRIQKAAVTILSTLQLEPSVKKEAV
jgi:hypothetical protein